MIFEKTIDGQLKTTETKVIEIKHDVKQLYLQKKHLEIRIAEVQMLIDQSALVGIDQAVEAEEEVKIK